MFGRLGRFTKDFDEFQLVLDGFPKHFPCIWDGSSICFQLFSSGCSIELGKIFKEICFDFKSLLNGSAMACWRYFN